MEQLDVSEDNKKPEFKTQWLELVTITNLYKMANICDDYIICPLCRKWGCIFEVNPLAQHNIYIDCQPVGEDGQLLVNESVSGSSMTSGANTDINMEQIEPFLYVVGGLILAAGISYGVNYLFTKFKKDK